MTIEGGTNGEVFRVFTKNILVPCLWTGAVVVMDYLSAHKVKRIQEIIEAAELGLFICFLIFLIINQI